MRDGIVMAATAAMTKTSPAHAVGVGAADSLMLVDSDGYGVTLGDGTALSDTDDVDDGVMEMDGDPLAVADGSQMAAPMRCSNRGSGMYDCVPQGHHTTITYTSICLLQAHALAHGWVCL